jgi:predicted metal-dependent hydrolase
VIGLQLGLPFELRRRSVSRGPVVLRAGAVVLSVHLVRVPRARRYILRVRQDGSLRVTLPRGGTRAQGVEFARRHLAWALRERARQLAAPRPPAAWTDGTRILIDGEAVPIVCHAMDGWIVATAGDLRVRVGAATSDFRPAFEAALLRRARRDLASRLMELATEHGLAVTRVSIRNQRSRWGSCSRSGAIALNFRLVQMPRHVREYILLHELMHLRQQNHSRRFWSLVASVCPGFREAERWLKSEGRQLF